MYINVSDEYNDFCDYSAQAGREKQKQDTFFENATPRSDPWSGLYYEAHGAAKLSYLELGIDVHR